jgi:hypothetical protein
MPEITSPKQFGLFLAAARGKATKAPGLTRAAASRTLSEVPHKRAQRFGRSLARRRKRKSRLGNRAAALAGVA